jgi:predicted GNAT superfamily acetyltransferase
MTYDKRDFYYNIYGDANDVEQLLHETLDFEAAEVGDFKGLAFHYLFATMAQDVTNALKTAMSKLNKRPVTDATFELWIMEDLNKASLALNKHMNGDNELTPAQPLNEEDTTIVHKYWTYSHARSYDIVHEAIQNRPSSCIKTTPECHVSDTEPSYESRAVSWGITRCDYQIGMVHTKSAFRGRGLGKAVIADLSLKVSQLRSEDTSEGHKSSIVHSYIDPENVVSKKLHADLGYKYHGTNYTWIRI